ncbi:DUF3618 domain-containing protein [Nocardioides sp. Kera G14]|uniref:DUF3618 domain-containing protein n=1 Tax=Nocardioides sp. Kera G14 TaxID=2884264 RepID=UPI001D1033C7|nr:DUF3618 domain-containing protein [Nocardioides sp. Kera G14]UDY24433.1 DUF3618 domain-containing protein [Nocardioides sp. Kera G14]
MTKDSANHLETEMDEIRERLAGTIDELLYRSSPKTIASRQIAAVKAAYVDPTTGQPKVDNILKTVGIIGGVVGTILVLRRFAHR